MPDTVTAAPPAETAAKTEPVAPKRRQPTALERQYPTTADLRKRAKRVLPYFAYEYIDGGAGDDRGIRRNWDALDAVELAPRYGKVIAPPPTDTTLFGRSYSAPIGVAPIGGPGTGFPGAEIYLATAAQAARVPYTLGLLSGITVERAAELAPDVLWFQLYRFWRDDHRIGLDLVDRAEAAGVHVLVLTIDSPTRTTRSREVKAGITNPFKLGVKLGLDAMTSPQWMASMMRNGIPKFVCLGKYMNDRQRRSLTEAAKFIRQESGGAFTWDEVARYRDKWKKPLMVKGVLHPEDAERAVSLGVDGMFVTNHGGRQVEALPASIDALPAIARQVGSKATLILDSGVRSGLDAARAVALGADAAFVGKGFLWSLGALGAKGPAHLINILQEDVSVTLGQLGCETVADLRGVPVRHPGAWTAEDYAARR